MNDDSKTRRVMTEADENAALDALAAEWGDEYEIYITGDQWQAWARGAPLEDMLADDSPDGLAAQIQADSAQRGRSTS